MRKDVIPVEDAQGGPRSPRRFLRLLALLLAAFSHAFNSTLHV